MSRVDYDVMLKNGGYYEASWVNEENHLNGTPDRLACESGLGGFLRELFHR